MNNLEVDRSPVYGPLKWTEDNHLHQSYGRLMRWSDATQELIPIGQIWAVDPMGKEFIEVGDGF